MSTHCARCFRELNPAEVVYDLPTGHTCAVCYGATLQVTPPPFPEAPCTCDVKQLLSYGHVRECPHFKEG